MGKKRRYKVKYTVEIDERVIKFLKKVSLRDRRAIGKKIDDLGLNPLPATARPLRQTDNCYKLRHGRYRIVYQLQAEVVSVYVLRVGDRKDVYRDLFPLT